MRSFGIVALLLTAMAGGVPAFAQQAIRYPIVFIDTFEALHRLGIGGDLRPLKNKCYHYGEASYRVSLSDDFLARYQAKGFTLESLCLALISEARFDPETGQRLPTYIRFHAKELQQELAGLKPDDPPGMLKYKGRDPRTFTAKEMQECCDSLIGFISEEQPLAVPPCFKNGNPYSDCTWRYAIKSGQRLSDQSVEKFRQLGRAMELVMAIAIRSAPMCREDQRGAWPCTTPRDRDDRGWLAEERTGDIDILIDQLRESFPSIPQFPPALFKGNNATLYDISSAFPRGFGYALYADGGAGPSVSLAAVRGALGEGEPASRVNWSQLRRILEP